MLTDKSLIRKEALLNEYKGGLYEFLVAKSLSQVFKIEIVFMNSLSKEVLLMLEHQEKFLRTFYPELLSDLPKLAQSMSKKIISYLEVKDLEQVEVIGKLASSFLDGKYGETDLILHSKTTTHYLSLKLGKAKSYLNTKSGGIKSFLEKYFADFSNVKQSQSQFSRFFEKKFDEMAYRLHEVSGIEYTKRFESWVQHGKSELPGSLNSEEKMAYLHFTHSVSNYLFKILEGFYRSSEQLFINCLFPLIGHANKEIVQAITYYKKSGNSYSEYLNHLSRSEENLEVIELVNHNKTNHFEIRLLDRSLQIRLKAMNKFTSPSFKINCSVKFHNL